MANDGKPEMASKLSELAERCEQAEGPSRALDVQMWVHVSPEEVQSGISSARGLWPKHMTDDDRKRRKHDYLKRSAPHFTASIDAALTLVPEGWSFSIGEKRGLPEHIRMFAWLNDHNTPDGIAVRHTEGSAHTPALALCAAALRARSLTPPSTI